MQDLQSDAFSILLVSCLSLSAAAGAISNGIPPTITHLYGNGLKSGKYRIPLKWFGWQTFFQPQKSNLPFLLMSIQIAGVTYSWQVPGTTEPLIPTPYRGLLTFCRDKIWSYGCPARVLSRHTPSSGVCGLFRSKVMAVIFPWNTSYIFNPTLIVPRCYCTKWDRLIDGALR